MNTDQNPYNQGYPPQQFGGYPPQQPNPYGQNQMPFQPPPMVPRPDFPKAKGSYSGVPTDYEEQGGAGEWGNFQGLDSKQIRQVFVRKVYLILSIQLLITFGIIALFHFLPEVRQYVRSSDGRWLYFTSYVVFLVVYLALVCSKRAARRFPLNMILLGVLTISMGYMMGMISAYYTTDSVLKAVGITVFVCLGISLFSMQTKYDFTNCFGILFVISLALMGFGIVCIITRSAALSNIYAGLGAVAFSIFLAVDTQLIIGGKRHEISAEDHVFASIMLYLDVVYIFIYILQLLGQRE